MPAMGLVSITRTYNFSASHKLCNPAWSTEQNATIFGPCANENWHGHNFVLEVTVQGTPGPTGYVAVPVQLDELIEYKVIVGLDGKNLNEDVDYLHGLMPSCETLISKIYERIEAPVQELGNCRVAKLRIVETNKNSVELSRELIRN